MEERTKQRIERELHKDKLEIRALEYRKKELKFELEETIPRAMELAKERLELVEHSLKYLKKKVAEGRTMYYGCLEDPKCK